MDDGSPALGTGTSIAGSLLTVKLSRHLMAAQCGANNTSGQETCAHLCFSVHPYPSEDCEQTFISGTQ